MKKFIFILAILAAASRSYGHAVLTSPAPRANNSGNQSAPCGPYAHMSPVIYKPGQQITITWEETIHHPGSFEVYFSSANDANLSVGKNPAGGPTPIFTVAQSYSDSNVPHFYSATITLPNTTCTGCTLQFVQVATDGAGYYFSCADIQLSTTATPTPAPTATPTPTPPPTTSTGGAPVCLSPTYTNVNKYIIQPLCVGCHSGGNPATQGGYDYTTYAGLMNSVNTKNPLQSQLYTTTMTQTMPQNADASLPVVPLTGPQEQLILNWLQSGAPNN